MERLRVVFEPEDKVAHVDWGTTILDAASSVGVQIDGPCGGRGICGKCRVKASDGLSDPTTAEKHHLLKGEMQEGFRLACQARIIQDTTVEIPWVTKLLGQSILDRGVGRHVELDPDVKKLPLKLPQPTLEDQRDDLRRVQEIVAGDGELHISLEVLKKLPKLLRENDFRITVVLADGELVDVEGGDTSGRGYGISFDIGTTTVVGYLVDLITGEQVGVSSLMNPQVIYGDDVISRITYVSEREDGLRRLHEKIIGGLNEIIDTVADKVSVDPHNIYEAVVVGNTCMHHLFLGLDPRNIAPTPFIPVASRGLCTKARDLGLRINPNARVHTLPNIAGYVGADIVGDILATNLWRSNDIKLLVDIGTNGEIVMGSRRRLISCSTAAGPAFEGARISQGMRAAAGAIDKVAIGEEVEYTTIGGAKARGICGSGLLDAVAEMIRVGVVDPTGRIADPGDPRISAGDGIRERIEDSEVGRRFLLVRGSEADGGKPIYITQRDIRELQLGKGAIRAGIKILRKLLGIECDDISEVLLAGAFGNYLRKESAVAVGLLPEMPLEKIKSVGNSAGEGAKIALISKEERRLTEEIAHHVEYVELSAQPEFATEFAESMIFPEKFSHVSP
ncbi:MAG: ASKHA domain-containing protein [bacterium]